MRKALLIMAAALMTLAQCRKQETVPATPSANTIKMTVTAGSGAKTDITDEGKITWTSGDVLYVSDGAKWLGSLTLVSGAGNVSGTFTGTIQEIGDGVKTCHFFYLGHDNGMAEPSGENAASISFASQDGSRDGALKYHLGHGSAEVTVSGGEATGAVAMRTEIAIAHLKLTMNSDPYPGSVTMGGTGISNTLSVSPDGSFSGSGTDGITIAAGTSGDRYVTLIPTTGTESVDVTFSGSATGSLTFGHGIQANNLYGMANGIEVPLEAAAPAGRFTVNANGTKVDFAPGNLYWDGSAFHFESDQWSSATTWDASHVSHFRWSPNKDVAVGTTTMGSGTMSDVFFTNATETTASSSFQVAGEKAETWRTLSKDEWAYLLGTVTPSRDKAVFLCAWVNLTDVNVYGLVILPDDSTVTPSTVTTTALVASSGAVFLRAVGNRTGTTFYGVNVNCNCSSSTPCTNDQGYCLSANGSATLKVTGLFRTGGVTVRLVR